MSSHDYNQQLEYDEIHAVLKACQSFYELPSRNHCYGYPLKLSPRLEDGLSEMSNLNHANPQDATLHAMQEDQTCFYHTEPPSNSSLKLNEVVSRNCNESVHHGKIVRFMKEKI